jgi:flagellar biosynthetic protein FlhB
MSDERTQTPSKRRRQLARERGEVARSPELTAAVGLLAAVILLAAFGGSLIEALCALVQAPWIEAPLTTAELGSVVGQVLRATLAVATPLAAIGAGVVLAMLFAHQLQVGGLWSPGLLAPDPARLWRLVEGTDLSARGTRGIWSILRAIVIVGVAAAVIYAQLPLLNRLGQLDAQHLARTCGVLIGRLAFALAIVILALGAIDYWLQFTQFEARLKATPQEQREDQRAEDGDPAQRARRRRLAQEWHQNPAALVSGATLIVSGWAGLSVALSGGPPPRRLWIRPAARGLIGLRVRALAQRSGVPCINAPELARKLARRPDSGRQLPSEWLSELAAVWPNASHGGS